MLSDVHFFNPTCDFAIGNGRESWQPNKLLQKMESDLSVLPMHFANNNDIVLTDFIPSTSFLELFNRFRSGLPFFVLKNEVASKKITEQQINRLLPWGWSPSAHKYLEPYKQYCSEQFKKSPVFEWKNEYRELYSRKFALSVLKELLATINQPYIISDEMVAKVCLNKQDIEFALRKWGKIMVKAPWSSSGRGLQTVNHEPIHPKVWEKLLSVVNEQGFVLAEPFQNKVFDMAFEFELSEGKVTFLGFSFFSTDQKGQYIGNFLNGLPSTMPLAIKNFVKKTSLELLPELIRIIEASLLATNYEGIFGIDTLIYTDLTNQLKINPCLEINLRRNMGYLSLFLEKLIHPNKQGAFKTYFQPGNSYFRFKSEMETSNPLIVNDNKIVSGFLSLTDPTPETMFGAYIIV